MFKIIFMYTLFNQSSQQILFDFSPMGLVLTFSIIIYQSLFCGKNNHIRPSKHKNKLQKCPVYSLKADIQKVCGCLKRNLNNRKRQDKCL